jgi:hypothetical protein
MQARLDLTHIEMVALEEVGFLLLKKSRCPFVNQIGDDQFAPINQHLACAPHNLFNNGTFTHVYKPSYPDV